MFYVRRHTRGLYAPRSSTVQQYGTQDQGLKIKINMFQRCTARWTLKRYHNTSSISSMHPDLGWRSVEQRRADLRLTRLYKVHKGHVPIEASKHLQPMKCRSQHSHSNSFIPLWPVPHLTICHSTWELLLNGTVYPSLFKSTCITMTLLLFNILSLRLSVTILSTSYFSCWFIV